MLGRRPVVLPLMPGFRTRCRRLLRRRGSRTFHVLADRRLVLPHRALFLRPHRRLFLRPHRLLVVLPDRTLFLRSHRRLIDLLLLVLPYGPFHILRPIVAREWPRLLLLIHRTLLLLERATRCFRPR